MIEYIQSDFSGGMNLFDQDTGIGSNQYLSAFNVRNRRTYLQPIKLPVEDIDAPLGKKQGIYAFDKYILLFAGGKAYYKDIELNSNWIRISPLLMDPTVDYIYAQAVPASTLNYSRKLTSDQNIQGTGLDSNIQTTNIIIAGNPAGLVVQDGISRPWIIFPDGTTRQLLSYTQWTLSNREYVPIMTKMVYMNGILLGVGSDGKTIFRSVSGRPLDFVINVDINGNKGGDATTTSYAVGFQEITAMLPLITGELFVATENICSPIEFNYDKTIFAEPTFLNRKSFASGVTNHFSIIDMVGDYGFIDTDGVRSLNSIFSNGNEGRNSNFSSHLLDTLKDIKQSDVTAAVLFDNYAIFSINTSFGYVNAVWDTLRSSWVSFDRYSDVAPIKMFAVANQSDEPTLYGITEDNVYKFFQSDNDAEAEVNFKNITTGECKSEIKLENFRAILNGSESGSNISATSYINEVEHKTIVESTTSDLVDNINFNFQAANAGQGWKIGMKLVWNDGSKLSLIELNGTKQAFNTALRRQAKLYATS
jgi:hypothetical protein